MNRMHSRSLLLAVIAVSFVISLAATSFAQTLPRPAVEVRQMPELWDSLWPADFNEDGITDLVAGQKPPTQTFGRIVVRIGRGDGTFGASIESSVTGIPVNTGDFNADGFIDVVFHGDGGAMGILPGRGDGTFGSVHTLDAVTDFRFALSGHFNDDGHRDLVIAFGRTLQMNPGNGDFTFGPQNELPAGGDYGGNAGVAADFNGDDRLDLAVPQLFGSLFIYLNQGGMLFNASEIFIANDEMFSITARDLDGDGDEDLVVPHTFNIQDWNTGGVDVLKGNGDGTFAAAVRYHTGVDGPYTVVAGNFNGDAHVDIAVGSRSWSNIDRGFGLHYWDSISIFPGRGDGTLAPASTFRLDTVPSGATSSCIFRGSSCYLDSHHSLKTSDVNGDGRTDLIASPGAILTTRASAANRLPTVNAGPDITVSAFSEDTPIIPTIAEPDWEWLTVEWRDETGAVIERVPSFIYQIFQGETHTLTVTVTDARGGTASDSVVVTRETEPHDPPQVTVQRPTDEVIAAGQPYTIRWSAFDDNGIFRFNVFVSIGDRDHWTPIAECTDVLGDVRSCVWRNPGPITEVAFIRVVATDIEGQEGEGQSDAFRIRENPTGPGGMPIGWSCGPLGAVGATGSCAYAGGVFTIRGSGADIWGTADELQFAGMFVDGNSSITARVRSVENVNQWTKVGIMLRDWNGGNAGSRHASFFVTPTTVKGTAFQRRATQGGTSVHTAGPVTTAPVWVKLARVGNVISAYYRKNTTDAWTLVGRQTFAGLPERLLAMLVVSSHADGRLATGTFDNVVVDETEAMESTDIGTATAGTTISDTVITTIEGNGADIWGTADAFRYHYARWSGDGTITVRVRSVENTNAWVKAGVMFREFTIPGSKHVMAIVSAGRGIALQSRTATDGVSTEHGRRTGTAPEWVRLVRSGNTFTASSSNDGVTWSALGSVTVAMQRDIVVGLPVTSHTAGTLATAVFDDLLIQP